MGDCTVNELEGTRHTGSNFLLRAFYPPYSGSWEPPFNRESGNLPHAEACRPLKGQLPSCQLQKRTTGKGEGSRCQSIHKRKEDLRTKKTEVALPNSKRNHVCSWKGYARRPSGGGARHGGKTGEGVTEGTPRKTDKHRTGKVVPETGTRGFSGEPFRGEGPGTGLMKKNTFFYGKKKKTKKESGDTGTTSHFQGRRVFGTGSSDSSPTTTYVLKREIPERQQGTGRVRGTDFEVPEKKKGVALQAL